MLLDGQAIAAIGVLASRHFSATSNPTLDKAICLGIVEFLEDRLGLFAGSVASISLQGVPVRIDPAQSPRGAPTIGRGFRTATPLWASPV